ncbi:MAG: Gfo/Idh/MocA family oxidoreductase [Pirellulaceae bacterium]
MSQPSTSSPAPESTDKKQTDRRTFLKGSTAAVVGGSLAATLAAPRSVHASVDDTIKVGLIGCGGRGKGAAVNAMRGDDNIKLTAMADAFEDQIKYGREILSRQLGDQFDVSPEQSFFGFDAYKRLLETDVDVVLLCTPPHFRPEQLKAAIAAGKHVFCEKPVAVDPTGVRSVLETTADARKHNLSIVSGLCWRYDLGVRETVRRIKEEKAIGDIIAMQENYLTGTLWHRGSKPEWSQMEYQMRNWLYFTWLSGDHIVEQHIHSLDKSLWLMDDVPPARCFGLGGRQVRTEEEWGHIFDHFAVCYEWDNGVKMYSYTRQMKGCAGDVDDYILGTKGQSKLLKHTISADEDWRYRGPKPSMYDVEHKELYAGIRSGNLINNGEYMSYSTLMAIMGREACYTGQTIDWETAINSKQKLGPDTYEWGDVATPEIAMPGVTTFA